MPTISMDYGYLGLTPEEELRIILSGEEASKDMPILVTKGHKDRWIGSHAVPCKGVRHEWGARMLANDVIQSGFPRVILKSDGEPAIIALKRLAA